MRVFCVLGQRVKLCACSNIFAFPPFVNVERLLSELDAKDDTIRALEDKCKDLQERCTLLKRAEEQTSADAEIGYLKFHHASKQVLDLLRGWDARLTVA